MEIYVVSGFNVYTYPKVLFNNTIISYLAFKMYKVKMECRINNICQDWWKLDQCVYNSLYRDMDIILEFSKTTTFENTVKRLTDLF